MVGESRGGSRSNVVWFFFRFGRQRGFGKRAIGHIAFHSGLRLYFYVAFHAADNLDRFPAFQFGGEVEINDRFVDPHPVFVHGALYVRGAGLGRRDPRETCNKYECSKRPTHFFLRQHSRPVACSGRPVLRAIATGSSPAQFLNLSVQCWGSSAQERVESYEPERGESRTAIPKVIANHISQETAHPV
jgi:hypothetical protein